MNRRSIAVLVLLGVASTALPQSTGQAILRTAAGDRQVATLRLGSETYFSVADVIGALGGSVAPDSNGFKVTLRGATAAFGTDSRFAVVKDDLIEMPVPPVALEGRPFAPWQFFQGFLRLSADSDVSWSEGAHTLQIIPLKREISSVQLSVANVQGISKAVFTFSAPTEYNVLKEAGAYTIRFRNPIKPPFSEQTFEDPNVSKVTFDEGMARIQLSSPDVVGDTYRLENPLRLVIDLRKGAPGSQTTPQPTPAPLFRPTEQPGIRTIVLDPGHGGKDVGATGTNGLMEKDATLAICRKLQSALASKLGTRVILTRSDDSVVSLDQRTAIANQYKADLFLSLHLNSAVVKGAHGSETYFLSVEASDELARRAAEVENGPKTAAPAATTTATAADLKFILWDLAQQEYLKESSRFAQDIQEEMNQATGVENRGVKQAPFKVLVGATMPAALVEVGFISNPDEESKIQKDEFQNLMVAALERAIERYKIDYEIRIGIASPVTRPAEKAVAPATDSRSDRSSGTR
jgi:N-acetylmuramoyl-L-alanine amidase